MRNNYMIQGNTVYIEIKVRGRQEILKVDKEDLEKLKGYNCTIIGQQNWKNHIYGLMQPWNKVTKKVESFFVHRLLIDCPKGYEVNHINGDTLDCRKNNLEIITKRENLSRKRKPRSFYYIECVADNYGRITKYYAIGPKSRFLGEYSNLLEAESAITRYINNNITRE